MDKVHLTLIITAALSYLLSLIFAYLNTAKASGKQGYSLNRFQKYFLSLSVILMWYLVLHALFFLMYYDFRALL